MEETTGTTTTGVTCPDCKALVSDLDVHKQWHSRLVKTLATAVEDEIKRAVSGR